MYSIYYLQEKKTSVKKKEEENIYEFYFDYQMEMKNDYTLHFIIFTCMSFSRP